MAQSDGAAACARCHTTLELLPFVNRGVILKVAWAALANGSRLDARSLAAIRSPDMADIALTRAAAASEGRGGRFAATIVLGHALKHLYISSLASQLLPEIKAGLSLSATQLGSLATVQQFSGWFATMTSGYLGDRFAGRTAFLLALSIGMTGASYFVLGSAASYGVALVTMLFVGLGPSIYHPPALGALARRFRERRALMISLHGAGGSLGEAVGPLLAGGLLTILIWRDILQLSLVPALVAAFLIWRLLGSERLEGVEGGATSFTSYLRAFLVLMKNQPLLLICLATALRSVGQTTTSTFLPVYLRDDLGYSAGLRGLYLALAQVVGIGAQPFMGYLADRFGHKRVLVPSLAALAVCLLLIPAAEGKVQLAIVILAMGAFVFSLHAILLSAAAELVSQEMQATSVSLIYASSFIGALSPTLAGVLADEQGLKSVFLFGFVMVALSAVVLAATRLPGHRRGQPVTL
jgi:MFS family permease